jgi:hypothetical protein
LKRLDEIYADPDAVRGAVRALADLKDASGAVIRLSDDAVEGAVKFVAKAGADFPAAERELLLKNLVSNGAEDAEATLRFVKGATDPDAVPGLAKYFKEVEKVPCLVP